ncbi:DNA-directed RNA polymerase subunit omega [Crocosphaera chwakensis]|uniref:DNA-directed RNA polymerase subunit omega n=1 Tax=Crocosphaera chwakensis CCY0110 TaxID=391612 RepID=A3IWC6_9CHRO|nr:DNA-directed RNA polymerase subunit omega [Crocosphaera chwakensis]EAZ89239.1 DNA-directed RNA polymerase subunit omega [Crocosphaera chwakensis CCY0110]
MVKQFPINPGEMVERADRLMSAASNRYRVVVQVSRRAKRCRHEDNENSETPMMKPVIRAVLEMSDEFTEPEIIGHELN